MKRLQYLFILIFLLWGMVSIAQSGTYLQIEEIGTADVIKIPVGSKVIFKASTISDQWQRGVIQQIDYDGNVIVFDHTFITLDKIEKIKIQNLGGEAFGWMLQAFGVGWLGFGALADLADAGPENNLNKTNLIVGATAIGSGWLIQKTTGNKVYTSGKTHRFRLIDTRFRVEKE